jgi:hypothetical protein
MSTLTVTFTTRRSSYNYGVFNVGTSFKNEAGNYMFAYQGYNGWHPVYIGQSNDLGQRLANHPKWLEAKKKGATHILAHLNSGESARMNEEADLIAFYQPPCNDLLK